MKNLVLSIFLLAGGFAASAQVKVNVDVNIGNQPVWGPTGYDHAEYYYMPEYDMYYDVPHRQYVYLDGTHWRKVASLPSRFHNVDLYHTYKVVLNEPKAYLHHDQHLREYVSYKGRHDQAVIRDSHDEKYWVIKEHPEHNKWHDKGHDHR